MPIEISCTSCKKRLRVPDNAAGKRVKCPQCQSVLSVPAAGAGSSAGQSGGGTWHLKTEDGQTFGPVPKKELDQWLAEGRVTGECQLLKDGADQWQWASDVYPQLSGEAAASGSAGGGFPQIDVGTKAASDNPFAFAAQESSVSTRVGGGRRTASTSVATRTSATSAGGAAAATGDVSDKSKMVAGLLELLLPMAGIHGVGRFYLGYTGLGIAQLLTCGGCGVWSLIDGIMMLTSKVPDVDGRPLKD
jgi:hypothetical protein